MDSLLGECSVMKEISKTEEAIKTCYERVNKLENKLHSNKLQDDKKSEIQLELLEVQKLLATNEQQLSQLHRHNRKSFAVAAALCFVIFTVYALYIIVQGNTF